jgi:hypothetical protein
VRTWSSKFFLCHPLENFRAKKNSENFLFEYIERFCLVVQRDSFFVVDDSVLLPIFQDSPAHTPAAYAERRRGGLLSGAT